MKSCSCFRYFAVPLFVCLALGGLRPAWAVNYAELISEVREELRKERFAEALVVAKDALRADPQDYRGYYYAALANLGMERFDDADAAGHRAQGFAPADAQPVVEKLLSTIKTRREVAGSALGERLRAIAGVLTPRTLQDCPVCPLMVVVPAGEFEMGSSNGGSDVKPVHRVTVNQFALAATEVTQGQWLAVMGSNPSYFCSCGDICPVEKVSWDDAQDFVRKLSQMTGKQYRLPSEAEWEYACRAGDEHIYCGGDGVRRVAWTNGNSGNRTHTVGGKQANAWGLYDMSGNVWEWVEDCWNENYTGAPSDGSARTTGQCSVGRVLRGGSWNDEPPRSRVTFRDGFDPSYRGGSIGFRPAREFP